MPASQTTALDLILPTLRCPVCGAGLSRDGGAVRCVAGHSFDIARHGYLSLLTGARPTSGDDAGMVQARRRFLEGGAYAPLREAITDLAMRASPQARVVLEAGCGTGYYLAGVLDALPDGLGLGLDSSARALRVAAKAHPRAAAAAWDSFRAPFPLAPLSVDLVLDVFAPRNPAEFQRMLRPDGRLIVARPRNEHLAQLRGQVERMAGIDPVKEERLHRALDPYFEAVDLEAIEYVAPLTPQEAADLVLMTPGARHLTEGDPGDDLASVALPAEVTVSVLATAYRPR
jgi:23S rRNA (guanine745-N1)-methyltransferase